MRVWQGMYAVVLWPNRPALAERFALFECIQKAVDTSFADRECPGNFSTTHAESVMLDNDVFIVQHTLPSIKCRFPLLRIPSLWRISGLLQLAVYIGVAVRPHSGRWAPQPWPLATAVCRLLCIISQIPQNCKCFIQIITRLFVYYDNAHVFLKLLDAFTNVLISFLMKTITYPLKAI